MLGLGQTSNFSSDEPNLVSHVYEKFDVRLNYVRLDEFGLKDRTSEDRLQDKRRSLSILTAERLGLFEFFSRLAPGFLMDVRSERY